jgi:hypothetical protein
MSNRLKSKMITNSIENPSKLAVLIGVPIEAEITMHNGLVHNDLVAMYKAIQKRGFQSNEIISLEGKLTRRLVIDFLTEIGRRIVNLSTKNLFFYYGGDGYYSGETAIEARVGVCLHEKNEEGKIDGLFWDEIFEILQVPSETKVTLLPEH